MTARQKVSSRARGLTVADVLTEVDILNAQIYDIYHPDIRYSALKD